MNERSSLYAGATVAAIVLAGGRGSRLGVDKAAASVGGRALLERVLAVAAAVADELVVVAAPGQALPAYASALRVRVVRDAEAYAGPLPGIVAGLAAVGAPVALLLPCDHPFLRPALLRALLAGLDAAPADAVSVVLPRYAGRTQPLPSALRTDVRSDVRAALAAFVASGTRAAGALADLPGALLLDEAAWRGADPDARSFIGVNTPAELASAEALAARFAAEG
ncbi:MAG: molybdenum cofactor guanylyltransferase [Dehalococcoidia bacterium]|nr:molybdenum cofactor guanylyltransferase [Dehalococcoidia bacterium]